MSKSCILTPEVSGEASKLYLEMVDKKSGIDRPTANFIYASYLLPGVAAAMDAAGYRRNKQGQHRFKDIKEFMGLKEFLKQQDGTIEADGILLGTFTPEHRYVDFDDVEEAFGLAQQYNNDHSGRLAYVVQHGNKYNVIITNKDSRTLEYLVRFNEQAVIWDEIKTKLRAAGIDIEQLRRVAEGMFNPLNAMNFLSTISTLKLAENDLLGIKDIKIFLTLGASLPKVRSLMSRGWGTLDEIAEKCYNAIQNPSTVSATTLALINNALNEAKTRSPFDSNATTMHIIRSIKPSFVSSSREASIQEKLEELEKDHQITIDTINRKTKEVKTMQDIASEAIATLTREIREIESKKGVTDTVKNLEKTKSLIAEELSSKRAFFGVTEFLAQALDYTTKIRDIIMSVPAGGTGPEYIRNCSEAISRAENLLSGYYHIVESLCNIESLIIDENITDSDKNELETKAKEIKKILDVIKKRIITELRRDVVLSNLQEELGDAPEHGRSYADIITMMEHDTSIVDYVGQLGKSSNAVLAASGSIIKNAQIERDRKLVEYSTRIGKATKKLYDAGYTSEFMYDENGKIITEEGVDWVAFNIDRAKAIRAFKDMGYYGIVLKEAIEGWERENTVEKVVDAVTGRTERIPDSSYWVVGALNPFNSLSAEEKEYYYEMMQIKGELGTLLPVYAQKQFLPPQIRTGSWDLIKAAIQKKIPAKKVAKILLDRLNPFKIREDDVDYITDTAFSDYDNTVKKNIPIFYLNKLNEQDELLKDFSSAIQSFAATALNYDAMSSIRDRISVIQDLVDDLDIAAGQTDAISVWDSVKRRFNNILIKLRMTSTETRTKAILDAWVEKALYNEKYKGSKKFNKIINSLIGYNSVIRLSANVLGATANVTAGIIQTVIEAGGRKYYNIGDLILAEAQMLDPGKYVGCIWDVLSGDVQNQFTLIHQFFDMSQDNYEDKARKRYHTNAFRRMFGKFNIMAMYSGGEFFMRSINGMAVLNHEKVLLNGKRISLSQAFDKSEKNGYPELIIKEGVTKLDGTPLTIDDPYLKEVKAKIKACSDDCFGAFSQEDKGVINQHWLGRSAMNFRQWMVEHYSRRYRGKHWDYNSKTWVEGYYATCWRFAKQLITGIRDLSATYEILKNDMTNEDRINFRKARWECYMWLFLLGLNFCLDDDDKDKNNFWERFLLYNTKRMEFETFAATPLGIIPESKKIINSPIPAINTVDGLLYPITGLVNGDVFETIERGRYEGWNKYGRNIMWYTIPFYKQVDQLVHMDEEDALFNIFENK